MTGFGEAHRQEGDLTVAVEVRTINNRHFKLSTRLPEGYAALEPSIEALIRQQVRRGTVQVSIRVHRAFRPEDFQFNTALLTGYYRQIEAAKRALGYNAPISLEPLLNLPGVVTEHAVESADVEAHWPAIEKTLVAALESLAQMRQEEGRAMTADLTANTQSVAYQLSLIETRAPQVIESYRERLTERLRRILDEQGVTLQPADILREVSIYSDRADISEEIVRLKSHLEQFAAILAEEDGAGRKLDFVTQEMFREANTIGSKSSDVEIARKVIEIKTAIERIREMIQNAE
jgi:uncharacterized protein (TIGR00255 family)